MSKAVTNEKTTKQNTITTRAEDYAQWYLDVIAAADLAEHSPVKGCMVIKPNGYAIWERIQQLLDGRFKSTGVRNAYFPLFIPERFLKREGEHIEGFAPEVAVVTQAGGKKLEEPLIVRPTSETIMYETFHNWIHSYRDLPLLINQWSNAVRWELRTRLFLRTTEFLWQEGHTVHETEGEADERARQMLEIYREVAEKEMAMPVVTGVKSESEKFAGALRTYSVEAMMQDGKALQLATSHNLGQNFSKPFKIQFLDRSNKLQYGWQTSWGLSTRSIGGLIMTHSDDRGLILPPRIAPLQVVITTIYSSKPDQSATSRAAEKLKMSLAEKSIRAQVDERDLRPGEKFFTWEKQGIPVRIELGPKDVQAQEAVIVRRDTGAKTKAAFHGLADVVDKLLTTIQADLYHRALAFRQERTISTDSWKTFTAAIAAGKFVEAYWSEEGDIEAQIKRETNATIRCISIDGQTRPGKCVKTGRPASRKGIFAQSY
ncbi:MAG: proline--tRNA ligase [Patescibacteria group bacterium]